MLVLASDAQVSFLNSLLEGRIIDEATRAEIGSVEMLDKKEASDWISVLRNLPLKPIAGNAKEAPAYAVLPEGIYFKAGEVYKVKKSGVGRMYATKLIGTSFVYDTMYIRDLAVEDKITLAQAREYGIKYGVCCICGRTLTDEVSVANGIGPVCAGRDWL